jgi:HEAT repeat protein
MRNRAHKILAVVAVALIAAALVAGPATDIFAKDKNEEAKSLYKEARSALNDDEYKAAAGMFMDVYDKYPDSKYAAESLYWSAFSMYRIGGKSYLKKSEKALELQFDKYGKSDSYDDARSLYYRVLGKLAEMGDEEAAQKIAKISDDKNWDEDSEDDTDCDVDEKMAAMHALLNMNPSRAYSILEKIYNNPKPGPCAAELREKSLFLLSQIDNDDAVDLLVTIARTDPDADVREQAVFWLSQTDSPKATAVLIQILEESDDRELQEKAIFSLSQIGDDEATGALKKVAMDESRDEEVRANAIFWLGQGGGLDDVAFLKELFGKLDNRELKEKILFGVSQSSDRGAGKWLMEVVTDETEDTEIRKNALFWAGQTDAVDIDGIVKVYKSSKDRELREQAVFALSQRNEKAAVRAMIDLARTEKDRELRKNLLFWIGQSDSDEAEEFLLEVINN